VPDLTPRRDRSPEEPVEPRGDEKRRAHPSGRDLRRENEGKKERKGTKPNPSKTMSKNEPIEKNDLPNAKTRRKKGGQNDVQK